ncbi:MAG: CBS domain-containing protein [Myxococcales bacterium]|nr:CBS domain-containing protein [Myxococcales bacterium]
MTMRIADVMTSELVTIRSEAPLSECRDLLLRHPIHHLPVVDAERVVGVVHAETVLGMLPPDHRTAAQVASRVYPWAYAHEALWDVLGRCAASLDDVCLVKDEQGRLVGILTERDVVRLAAEHLPASQRVDDIASTTLRSVTAGCTVSQATERIHRQMARHLVVVDQQGALLGLLSAQELLGCVDPQLAVGRLVDARRVVRVDWGDGAARTASAMLDANADAAVVMTGREHRAPDGLVTVTDLLRALRLAPAIAT